MKRSQVIFKFVSQNAILKRETGTNNPKTSFCEIIFE